LGVPCWLLDVDPSPSAVRRRQLSFDPELVEGPKTSCQLPAFGLAASLSMIDNHIEVRGSRF
jgi:hypothetical protein